MNIFYNKRYYDLFYGFSCVLILFFTEEFALRILTMFKQLNLYSTSHCHLCELAYSLAMQIPNTFVKVIDIVDDELLLTKYGMRIPVLQRHDTQAELNWPFSEADIHQLLQ